MAISGNRRFVHDTPQCTPTTTTTTTTPTTALVSAQGPVPLKDTGSGRITRKDVGRRPPEPRETNCNLVGLANLGATCYMNSLIQVRCVRGRRCALLWTISPASTSSFLDFGGGGPPPPPPPRNTLAEELFSAAANG
jgi:hypothetical protein